MPATVVDAVKSPYPCLCRCHERLSVSERAAGIEALDGARTRVFRLTQGHPFYADVTCREAANIARRLDQPSNHLSYNCQK